MISKLLVLVCCPEEGYFGLAPNHTGEDGTELMEQRSHILVWETMVESTPVMLQVGRNQ